MGGFQQTHSDGSGTTRNIRQGGPIVKIDRTRHRRRALIVGVAVFVFASTEFARAQSGDELRRDIAAIQNRLDALENGALGVQPCAAEDLCSGPCEPTCGGGCPPDCGDMAGDCAGYGACGGCGCLPLVGYDDGFFVRSGDGNFLFKLNGAIQANYVGNWRDPAPAGQDDFEGGFTFHRLALVPNGTLFTPALNYFAVILPTNSGGNDHIEECKMYYEFSNGSLVQFGRFRDPSFMRELDVAATGQLGMERSYVHSIFSTGILEGVALNQQTESLRGFFIVHDGRGSGGPGTGVDFTTDRTDIALSTSLDWKLFGEWAQYGDFASWPDEPWAMFLGAGYLWEEGETGDDVPANNLNNLQAWTADATLEGHGLNAFIEGVGRHSRNPGQPVDQFGLIAQAGYQVIPDAWEPFARYEYIDFGGLSNVGSDATAVGDSSVNLVSVGVNRYFHRNGAKIVFEVMHALDPIPVGDSFIGLLPDAPGADGQTVFRTQVQLAL
jgi:hypothetical protein